MFSINLISIGKHLSDRIKYTKIFSQNTEDLYSIFIVSESKLFWAFILLRNIPFFQFVVV